MAKIAPPLADVYKAFHFPKAGLDLSQAFWNQPNKNIGPGKSDYARSTAQAINVRAFEPATNRARGAARPGLSRYIPVTPGNALFITQELTVLVGDGYPPPGGQMQDSQSGRVVTLVAVSQGQVYVANAGDNFWTQALAGTGPQGQVLNSPPLNFSGLMYSAANNQILWFADGTNYVYYDPSINTLIPWVVGIYQEGNVYSGTPGTPMGVLPVDQDNNTPRLICTWRGRTVLSGLIGDPQNWFMSGVSDPTMWDYAPVSISPAQAVAGNNSPQGLIGDVVTALVPYTDDVMIFGGDHTIYMMRGDPMAGGQIDLISDAIGMAWGIPWCKDPYGNIYFFSNRTGIYSLIPGQQPQRISQGIEQLLMNIDTGLNSIRLIWNDRFQGLHVFITPLAEPTVTTHFFWEQRVGAWWQDQFANINHNPLCCCTFDGNDPGDRVPLIGSWDGYVRAIDPTATTDDGWNIASQVFIGPILTETLDDMMLKDIQAILGATSGTVNFAIYLGPTAEAALASTPVVNGTWTANSVNGGRNLTNFIRRAGHAVYIQLNSTSPWAMESIRARIATQGKVRGRGK